jgi:isocitrate/isopropylmalate dehydrogenase
VLVNPEARTRDLGGTADTRACGEAILKALA